MVSVGGGGGWGGGAEGLRAPPVVGVSPAAVRVSPRHRERAETGLETYGHHQLSLPLLMIYHLKPLSVSLPQ